MDAEAKVRCDGQSIALKADEVVPSDLALIATGDRLSADLRLLGSKGLKLDEAGR